MAWTNMISVEEILWRPDEEVIRSSNITAFTEWLKTTRGLDFDNYEKLWRWSVQNVEDFWLSIWQYFGVKHQGKLTKVLSSHTMPGVKWFEGIELNYAEVALGAIGSEEVLLFEREDGLKRVLAAEELKSQVRALAGYLQKIGVKKGDRVASILPNCVEAVIGLLATASIGAVWSSCSSDFGISGIFDRFSQIQPKVLITVDGYLYGGRKIDRIEIAQRVHQAIESIKTVIVIPYTEVGEIPAREGWVAWDEALEIGKSYSAVMERVPFNHPLWILYSSGTTGLPKPLVHSHGGIVLEHLKTLTIHNDIKKSDRFFWFTSTGWMMWNYLMGGLLLGSRIVLYDGSPSFPDLDRLWQLAEKQEITYFGTSAPYISSLAKANLQPASTHNLNRLRGIGSTGSPLSADMFRWVYRNVKKDVWLGSISGGTDVCTAFVGSLPTLPVIAGRIQCRYLGADVDCFDGDGKSVINQVGELVIKQPMPSMPIYLWNDPDYRRYEESYFSFYPGIWRHGDWIEIKDDGTCVIYGRSDATIKRKGVRIGTAEVYRVVESIPEIQESLAVDVEKGSGESFMVLFLVTREGVELDKSLEAKIRKLISSELSPRYVPDLIVKAPAIPKTLNGKKMEVPVKKLLLGADVKSVANPGSMSNPSSLEFYSEFSKMMNDALSKAGVNRT
ncbi:MAG: acetoacetate--CoA ligase [Conexivisphaerales archaeon]